MPSSEDTCDDLDDLRDEQEDRFLASEGECAECNAGKQWLSDPYLLPGGEWFDCPHCSDEREDRFQAQDRARRASNPCAWACFDLGPLAAARFAGSYKLTDVVVTVGGVPMQQGEDGYLVIPRPAPAFFGPLPPESIVFDQSALRFINKHRASYGQRPLDPAKPYGQAEPWTPADVRAHAVELGWENEG